MTKSQEILFHVLSCVVNDTEVEAARFEDFSAQDWEELYKLSKEQGVTAIVFDKISKLPQNIAPQKGLLMKWMSHSVSVEKQMGVKFATASEFAEKMAIEDIPVVVLKGFAVARYYPKPLQRECGDLDCYMMGKKTMGEEEAVKIGASLDEGNYKHSLIQYKGLTIEDHKYFTSFDDTKRGKHTEDMLLGLMNKQPATPLAGTALLCPNSNFNAFFLSKHALRHFIDEAISIRHILDWALFLKAEHANIHWEELVPEMENCWTKRFMDVLNYISINKLGLNPNFTGNITMSPDTPLWAEKVLEDTFGGHPSMVNESLWKKGKRILRRFRRIYKFRTLADEKPRTLIWNAFAYSSYLHREL